MPARRVMRVPRKCGVCSLGLDSGRFCKRCARDMECCTECGDGLITIPEEYGGSGEPECVLCASIFDYQFQRGA